MLPARPVAVTQLCSRLPRAKRQEKALVSTSNAAGLDDPCGFLPAQDILDSKKALGLQGCPTTQLFGITYEPFQPCSNVPGYLVGRSTHPHLSLMLGKSSGHPEPLVVTCIASILQTLKTQACLSNWGSNPKAVLYYNTFHLFFNLFLWSIEYLLAQVWFGTGEQAQSTMKPLVLFPLVQVGFGMAIGNQCTAQLLLLVCPAEADFGLRPKEKVPPGSCMQRTSVLIVCRGVLLFQSSSLKQPKCQKWGCKFKCIEANQSLFSIYYPFCCYTCLLPSPFSSGKHRPFPFLFF